MDNIKIEKSMTALTAPTIRGLIQEANYHNIKREDVINILKEGEQYILVCYK